MKKTVTMLGLLSFFFISSYSEAAVFCYKTEKSIGKLTINSELIGSKAIKFNGELTTEKDLNITKGELRSYSEGNGLITVKAFLDSSLIGDDEDFIQIPALISIDSQKIRILENDKIVEVYDLVSCPVSN